MLLVDVVAKLVPRLLADRLKNAMRPKPERIAFASCCFRRPSKGSHLLAAGSLRWVTSEEVSCPCHRLLAPRPVVFPRSWNRFGQYLPSSHPADEVLGLRVIAALAVTGHAVTLPSPIKATTEHP